MKKINSIFLTLGVVLVSFQSQAQDPNYRQNQFNALMLNPAQAGANSYNDISSLANTQWTGLRGAPKTMTLSGNFNILKNFGLGVSMLQDELGPVKSTQLAVNGAYHLKLNEKWRLSVGLRAIAGNTTINLTELVTNVPMDPDMASNMTTGVQFNAGYGMLLYHKNFYLGFAQPRVGQVYFKDRDNGLYVDTRGGYIGYIGGSIKTGDSWTLRPNAVGRLMQGLPFTLDMNVIMTHKVGFDFGLSYQLNSALGAIIGYDFGNKFYLGYSYTYPTSNLNTVSIQSHELALRYKFNNSASRCQGPRFFN
jgi:type IX secretion system PorP/SprF family membrane protein